MTIPIRLREAILQWLSRGCIAPRPQQAHASSAWSDSSFCNIGHCVRMVTLWPATGRLASAKPRRNLSDIARSESPNANFSHEASYPTEIGFMRTTVRFATRAIRAAFFAFLALLCAHSAIAVCTLGIGKSVSACNCTDQNQTGANVPHATDVEVSTTGSKPESVGNHSTGLSGTAFSNQTIPPHTCLYVNYMFCCEQVGPTWVCILQSFSMGSRPTEGADCP